MKQPWKNMGNSLDNKVHGANMGPIWDRQDSGGPHIGPMNIAIWVSHTNVCVIYSTGAGANMQLCQ